jgi:hypothetical protein
MARHDRGRIEEKPLTTKGDFAHGVPMFRLLLSLFFSAAALASAAADQPVRLQEKIAPGLQYRVSSRLTGTGTVTLPSEKDKQPAESLAMTGRSAQEYDERILEVDAQGVPTKTLRIYRLVDFHKTIGKDKFESTIRPEVRRMVVVRNGHLKVPFSPDGALLYQEIDLVRTDVFTPMLAGLLPAGPVQPGDSWKVSDSAIQALTDLEKIDEGNLECKFTDLATLAGRKTASIILKGAVRGLGEDGPVRHEIDGRFYFDLDSGHLSYLSFEGKRFFLNKDGKRTGLIEGTFTLTRQANVRPEEFNDAALRGLAVEPNDDNTLLLYDNPDLGVRFQYPRRWRIGNIHGRQITIETENGNGMLLTLEPVKNVPTAANYLSESQAFVKQQNGKLFGTQSPRLLQGGDRSVEQFALEVELGEQRILLDYYVLRQKDGGATLAARLLPGDVKILRPEVERIAKSVVVTKN